METIPDVRNLIAELRGDMHARFTSIDARFADVIARFTELTGRIASLDAKVDKQFVRLMGMMFTGFISVIGALVGIVYT